MSGWRAHAAVGMGSALGSLLRYLVSLALAGPTFPWGTLAVNAIGSGLIVGFATYAAGRNRGRVARWQPFLVAGFCGGFTTFSLFGLETLQLWQVGRSWLVLSYVSISVVLWLTAAWLGYRLGQRAVARS